MMKKVLLVLAVLALLVSLPATAAAKSGGGTKHRGAPARVVDKDKAAKDKTAKDGSKLKAGPEKPEKEKPAKEEKAKKACATIQSGQILSGDGSVIETGYDVWGYNDRARRFHGAYGDAGRAAVEGQDGENVSLRMKWDRAWLSDRDCDGDGELDRHHGFEGYTGSGARLTNHIRGEYTGDDGQTCRWNAYVRIKAAPNDAMLVGGVWFDADGEEIGPAIWEDFAIVHEIRSDPCGNAPAPDYMSPEHGGLAGA